jgi:hypothetical protein
MSDFLLNKDSIIIDLSADSSIDVSGHALVFNRGALGVDRHNAHHCWHSDQSG